MLSVDNTVEVKKLFEFDSNLYYYKFVVLVRRKDYEEGQCPLVNKEGRRELCVHSWLISSMEDYERLLPDMLTFVELFKARLYVTADRKDLRKTLIYARNAVSMNLDQLLFGQDSVSCKSLNRIMNSASSVKETSSKDYKCWMFDVDTKDPATLELIKNSCHDYYLCTLKTKSGYHVLARKQFDATRLALPATVELKDNSLALVAMY